MKIFKLKEEKEKKLTAGNRVSSFFLIVCVKFGTLKRKYKLNNKNKRNYKKRDRIQSKTKQNFINYRRKSSTQNPSQI